jgi:hypothetical protein
MTTHPRLKQLIAALALAATAPLPATGWAQPAQQINESTIAADLQKVQALVLEGIPRAELGATTRLKLVVPNLLDTQLLGAVIEGDQWVVQVPVGFYIRVLETSKALAVLPANAWAERWLLPYLHYLSLAELFDRPLLEFTEYVQLTAGRGEAPAFRIDASADGATSGMLLAGLSYVVGHELAHHLRGHTQPGAHATGQAQEEEADAEAMKYLVNAGINPAPAVFTFLLLAKSQDWFVPVSRFSAHPAPMKRGAVLAETAAGLVRKSSGPALARLTANGRFPIGPVADATAVLGVKLRQMHTDQQRMSQAGKAELMNYVRQRNVQAMLKLADLHATGASSEFAYDLERAAVWAETAADAATRLSLVDYGHANFEAARYRAFHETLAPDFVAACDHAQRSASVRYRPGLDMLHKLRQKGHCQ